MKKWYNVFNMKKTYTLISRDTENLLEMLRLRREGWTFMALAELYHCDRTTLRYQCRKYMIFPLKNVNIKNSNEVFDPKRIAQKIIIEIMPKAESKWIIIDGEKINTGRSYSDYFL